MATIRKRNNKYQVQVRIKGLSTSATLISLDHARRWARQTELELESKLKLGELHRPKNFKEIILQYKQKITPLKKSFHNENIIYYLILISFLATIKTQVNPIINAPK